MYIGRIVSVARMEDGQLCAMYRVSSRSFPNRTAILTEKKVSIVPKAGHESDVQKNPYIAYNCARIVAGGMVAVLTNGSQTDPIAEKIDMGMPVRDALALSMLALDYEKDDYNTPRISAVIDKRDGAGWLATVRHEGIEVERIPMDVGSYMYVATYEENAISPAQHYRDFTATNAREACEFILGKGIFADRENPVSAVAAVATDDGFQMHAMDVPKG